VLGRIQVITTWLIADGGENQKYITPIPCQISSSELSREV